MAELGYENFEPPRPIVTKCGMNDYVGDFSPHAKTRSDHPNGGVPANRWNMILALFLADVNSRSHSLIAVAIPSVVCLSVTLVRPT